MATTEPVGSVPVTADVEAWLDELGLTPEERVDRDGITSWDLRLDGLRRFDIRVTLILDPTFAAIVWVHFAPPISDSFRKSYRKLLHWNDDYPFAKFALGADERVILTTEVAPALLSRDELRQLASVDRSRHALVAWVEGDPQPVAIARLVREGASAEIAFAVADEYQHRGIGSALARELLADARAAGISEITALTGSDNRATLALLRRIARVLDVRLEGTEISIRAAIA